MKKCQSYACRVCIPLLLACICSLSLPAAPTDHPPRYEDHNRPERSDDRYVPVYDSTITGTILNEKGEPLSGATITDKTSDATATSNDKGGGSLQVSNANATLEISYVGFLTQELKLNNRSVITVTLLAVSKALEDVVVEPGLSINVKQS